MLQYVKKFLIISRAFIIWEKLLEFQYERSEIISKIHKCTVWYHECQITITVQGFLIFLVSRIFVPNGVIAILYFHIWNYISLLKFQAYIKE